MAQLYDVFILRKHMETTVVKSLGASFQERFFLIVDMQFHGAMGELAQLLPLIIKFTIIKWELFHMLESQSVIRLTKRLSKHLKTGCLNLMFYKI